jgi:hypothetical protein
MVLLLALLALSPLFWILYVSIFSDLDHREPWEKDGDSR